MRNSIQPQYEVRNTPAESFGRIARCTSVATPVLLVPAHGSANEADVASREVLDASARRAQAANGFGDAGQLATGPVGPVRAQGYEPRFRDVVARPTALRLEAAARIDRSHRVAELAIAVWRRLAGSLQVGVIPHEQRREPAVAEITPPVPAAIAFAPGDSPLLHKTSGMRELFADVAQVVAAVAAGSMARGASASRPGQPTRPCATSTRAPCATSGSTAANSVPSPPKSAAPSKSPACTPCMSNAATDRRPVSRPTIQGDST